MQAISRNHHDDSLDVVNLAPYLKLRYDEIRIIHATEPEVISIITVPIKPQEACFLCAMATLQGGQHQGRGLSGKAEGLKVVEVTAVVIQRKFHVPVVKGFSC